MCVCWGGGSQDKTGSRFKNMYGKFIDKYSYFDSNISFSLQVFVFCFYVFKRKNEAEKKSVLSEKFTAGKHLKLMKGVERPSYSRD